MHLLQPVEQGENQPFDRLGCQSLAAHQALVQRLALDQRHHHVGGAVGLEKVVHPHNGRAVEPSQGAGLIEEAFAAPGELLSMVGRARQHGGAALAQGKRGRQVLLDGHVSAQSKVTRPVGDAEGTLAED